MSAVERRLTDHDLWPRPGTRLLLRAALLDGAAAVAAFDAWLATAPPTTAERLDSPDRRLLPLVAAKQRSLGVDRPYLAVCDDVRRKTEARNSVLLGGAAGAVAALGAAGIEVLALKGLPLVLEHYGDPALRPMTDVDLMVRPADVPGALGALRAAGWVDRAVPDGLRAWVCAYECERADGASVDLHQYLIEYGSSPETEDGLWARSHPLDVLGEACRAPCPTDLLLHVCLAGLKYGRYRNSRWIADAIVVLERAGTTVDWQLLLAEAERRGAVLPVRECLQFLIDELGVEVPPQVMQALWRAPVGGAERLRYRTLTRNAPSVAQLVEEYWGLYAFGARASGSRRSPLGFLAFAWLVLAYRWRLSSRWQVPSTMVARLIARLGRRRASPR